VSLSSERLFSSQRRNPTMEHEDIERYDPGAVEARWQAVWAGERA
jgi:hypothetical protein